MHPTMTRSLPPLAQPESTAIGLSSDARRIYRQWSDAQPGSSTILGLTVVGSAVATCAVLVSVLAGSGVLFASLDEASRHGLVLATAMLSVVALFYVLVHRWSDFWRALRRATGLLRTRTCTGRLERRPVLDDDGAHIELLYIANEPAGRVDAPDLDDLRDVRAVALLRAASLGCERFALILLNHGLRHGRADERIVEIWADAPPGGWPD